MTHDHELGEALRALHTPEPRPQFWSDLRAELNETTSPTLADADEAVTSDKIPPNTQSEVALMPIQTTHTPSRRRPILLAAAAAVAIVLGASVAFANLRDDDTTTTQVATGPDPSSSSPTSGPASSPTSPPATGAGITEEIVYNLTYPSIWGVDGEVKLSDGTGEGESAPDSATKTIVGVHQHAFGDLDGDGVGDAIVVLVTDPGGSGTFYGLYAINGASNAVSEPVDLGDRVTDLQIAIETDHRIGVTYTDRDGTSQNPPLGYESGQLTNGESQPGHDEAFEQEAGTALLTIDNLPDVNYAIETCTADSTTITAELSAQEGTITVARGVITTPTDTGTAQHTISGQTASVNGTLDQQGPYTLTIYGCTDQVTNDEPPFPLFEPYQETGCWIAGESQATIDYLGDASTLIACEAANADAAAAATGGSIVDTIDGYTLITIPDDTNGS